MILLLENGVKRDSCKMSGAPNSSKHPARSESGSARGNQKGREVFPVLFVQLKQQSAVVCDLRSVIVGYGMAGVDCVINVENTQLPIAVVIMTHRREVWARMRKRNSCPGNFFHWGFSILAQTRIIFSIRSGYTLMAEDAVESAGAKAPAITISTRVQGKYLIPLFVARSECSRHPSLRRS